VRLNLNVDRVGITYSNGQSLGDPSSPVQLSSSVVAGRPIPARAMPEVVALPAPEPPALPALPRRSGGRPGGKTSVACVLVTMPAKEKVMPVIVVTRLRLKDPALLDEFFTDAVAAIEQATKSEGNLGADALADANNAWWSVA